MSDLYYNSPRVDMSIHSDTLSIADQSLLFILNAVWISEKHQFTNFIFFGLTWLLLEAMIHYWGDPDSH